MGPGASLPPAQAGSGFRLVAAPVLGAARLGRAATPAGQYGHAASFSDQGRGAEAGQGFAVVASAVTAAADDTGSSAGRGQGISGGLADQATFRRQEVGDFLARLRAS